VAVAVAAAAGGWWADLSDDFFKIFVSLILFGRSLL
jgi:hypothetical protein